MDWRTSDDPIAPANEANRFRDAAGSLAGVALISLSQHGHGCCHLGPALARDVAMARASRGRFGDVDGQVASNRVTG